MFNLSRFRFVTLHTKTAILFVIGLSGIIFSCLFITRYFFLYSLDELENLEIHKSSAQASVVIQSLVNRQEIASFDWAYWNESSKLITEHDPGFAERNMSEDSLDSLGIDFMAFFRANGEVLEALGRESNDAKDFTHRLLKDEGLQAHLFKMSHALDRDKTSLAGLVRVGEDIWVVSLTPVRDGDSQAAFSGWMLWGQHLSVRFPSAYEGILTADNVIITDLQAMKKIGKNAEHHHPKGSDDNSVVRTSTELIHYQALVDLVGKNIAILKTSEFRTYYKEGESVFFYLVIAISVVATFVALITFILFRNNVGKRFSYFEQDIKALISDETINLDNHKDEFERITTLVQSLADASSQTEGELKHTLQKFDALYQSQTFGMVLVVERVIVDVNQTLLDLLGYRRDDLVGQSIEVLCAHDDENHCSAEQLYSNLSQGLRQFEAGLSNRDAVTIHCAVEATQFEQDNQTSVMLSIKDISEQKQQAVLIDSLTHRDALSGLLNRPTVISRINTLFLHHSEETTCSALYFNATRLREIDEIYGHIVHSKAVKNLSDSLIQHFDADHVGRISENEFLVWRDDNSSLQSLERKGNAIVSVYSAKINLSDFEFDVGLKAALIPSLLDFDSFEDIIYSGLYTVTTIRSWMKKGVMVVDDELSERARESLVLNRDIVSALKNGEIIAHYQPIVQASTGRVVGFEALARWNHLTFGMVSPAFFIPLAEQRRLIVDLGEQILEQACQFLQELQQHSSSKSQNKFSIHVNLSSPHFYHRSLVDTLTRVIEKYQLTQGQLVLELTESILLGAENETIERMEAIKSLGVQLALDDFGTGYSSFSSLCNFPLDIIKLDKSYIDNLETNDKAKSIVRNIINMSQELGMTTVAEGVETASQLRKLNVWNVDEIQGYYFFKPMDKESALEQFSN